MKIVISTEGSKNRKQVNFKENVEMAFFKQNKNKHKKH